MQGEFRGDFTRDTFNPGKHFLRVLTQQGRVQLDADPNEQSSIIIHYLQSLAVDLMGSHAAPVEGGGFTILATDQQINDLELVLDEEIRDKLKKALKENGLIISKGKYYVNGILCDIDDYTLFFDQPDLPFPLTESRKNPLENGKKYLIYIDVWERHISYIQDEMSSGNDLQNPSIREMALSGVDTTTRSQIVWQVKIKPFTDEEIKKLINPPPAGDLILAHIGNTIKNEYSTVFLKALGESIAHPGRGTGKLQARAKKSDLISANPCIINPSSSFNGTENQLYRVEIHQDGTADNKTPATFKWSRENSSVVFPIRKLVSGNSQTITITIAHLGQDVRFTLKEQNWVEIVDDDYIIQNNPNNTPLFKIDSIDRDEQTVILSATDETIKTIQNIGKDLSKHPFLRRWDRDEQIPAARKDNNGVQNVEEGTNKWLPLENGIEICFPPNTENSPAVYRKGDYWLIPARTATGDVEWPGTVKDPSSLPPHGIVHNYAPLALISVDDAGIIPIDCRRKLKVQWH
jgi:hypothetical protein